MHLVLSLSVLLSLRGSSDGSSGFLEAAIEVKNEKGYVVVPEIMIPLVGEKKELKFVKDVVVEVAEQVKSLRRRQFSNRHPKR